MDSFMYRWIGCAGIGYGVMFCREWWFDGVLIGGPSGLKTFRNRFV